MHSATRAVRTTFDVICVGDVVWNVALPVGVTAPSEPLTPNAGAVSAALDLSREALRVGLATVLPDDRSGRSLLDRVARAGVSIEGVELAPPESGLFLISGGARQVMPTQEAEKPPSVPDTWESQILLLSGMSPLVSHGAALCKAARTGRRLGSIVVVDVNAVWHAWKGHDPRAIRMVLREADVVWCSAEDLLALNWEVSQLRDALRNGAILAMSNGSGGVFAAGPFGEVALPSVPSPTAGRPPFMAGGHRFAVGICLELVRPRRADESSASLWRRALERGLRRTAPSS